MMSIILKESLYIIYERIIKFLVKEDITNVEIHHRLQCADGDISRRHKTSIRDQAHRGCFQTASTAQNTKSVDDIKEDRHPVHEIGAKLAIGHCAMYEMIET